MPDLLRSSAAALCVVLLPMAAAAVESPRQVTGATTVSPQEALELFDAGVAFVDVRKQSDYDAGRVPGAYHLDVNLALTQESLAEIAAPGDPVLFYCNGHSCMRSSEACDMAVGWGYSQVYYLRDGYPAWDAAGYPIE
jgi:rhodanese-related sulfurtransferase